MDCVEAGEKYLASLTHWNGGKTFDLEVTQKLMAALGNPQDAVCSVHVAGTNGKGSVCALLSSMLRAEGFKVGQFTSPHLIDVRERCMIDGAPVSREQFFRAAYVVEQAAREVGVAPSFFEAVTAISFWVFSEAKVDWMVIEVGLGGRLDATNVLKRPEATVITTIDFDHEHILGDTLSKIAREKAGIIKECVAVFCGKLHAEASDVICEVAKVKHSKYWQLDDRFLGCLDLSGLALKGRYQRENAAVAISVARFLGLAETSIAQGLEGVSWPGRLELTSCHFAEKRVPVLLDVSHNPAGLTTLIDYLRGECCSAIRPYKSLTFVVSILDRKDWRTMLGQFKQFSQELEETNGVASQFIFTASGHSAQVPCKDLAAHFRCEGSFATDPCQKALCCALEMATADSLIVVTGSLYLVGALREYVIGAKALS